MAQPGNGTRPPRRSSAERRRQMRQAELANALEILYRCDRDLLAAIVTLIRYGDLQTLRAVRVIAGLTLRVSQRRGRKDMGHLIADLWSPW
jgi:hypothetical protein